MKWPKLADAAQVAEVVAAVAVVLSLLYVGREVQSNTSAVRAGAVQAVTDRSATSVQTLAADSTLSRIVRVGDADPSSLTEGEAFQYHLWTRGFWLQMQSAYVQYQLGVFESSVWRGYNNRICGAIADPGKHATWTNHRDELSPEFVAVVEACRQP